MSIDEWQRTAKTEDVIRMLLKTPQKEMLSELFYGKII